MKEYIYLGPLSGVSLKEYGDIMLHPVARVKLPEDHPYTKRLMKRGWLADPPAESKTKTKKETNDAS